MSSIYDGPISNRDLDQAIAADIEAALVQLEATLREKYPEGMAQFAEDDSVVSVSEPSYQHTRDQFKRALIQRLRFPRWLRMA